MKGERASEKSGWILGWGGGFTWVVVLAIVSLVKGDLLSAALGGLLAVAAAVAIPVFAPWRRPTQPYWRLMVPIYLLFFLSFAWLIWGARGAANLGLNAWSLFLLLPLMLPFYLAGRRRWIEGEHQGS